MRLFALILYASLMALFLLALVIPADLVRP
jgi:hypothetical protein